MSGLRKHLKTVSYKSMPLQSNPQIHLASRNGSGMHLDLVSETCHTIASHSFLIPCGTVIVSLQNDCKIISIRFDVISSLIYIEKLDLICAI